MSTWEDSGTVPCLRCGREVRWYRRNCPYCGERIIALPGAVDPGGVEGEQRLWKDSRSSQEKLDDAMRDVTGENAEGRKK